MVHLRTLSCLRLCVTIWIKHLGSQFLHKYKDINVFTLTCNVRSPLSTHIRKDIGQGGLVPIFIGGLLVGVSVFVRFFCLG